MAFFLRMASWPLPAEPPIKPSTWPGTTTRNGGSTSTRPSRGSRRSRFRCTAGRATTSAASRTPGDDSAAASRSPATTPARPAPPRSCAPTSTRPCRLIPGTHRSTSMPSTPRPAASKVDRDALGPSTSQGWIDWAKANGIGHRFQPHLLLASEGRRRLHARPRRRGHPPVLDRARHRLPQDRRGDRQGAWARPCVTNVWIPDGYKDTPVDRKGPRERLDRVARRDLRRADRPEATTSTPSRASSSASAPRATSSARTSSTSATPSRARSCSASTPATIHPTEVISDKISSVLHVPRRDPAARQPGRALGQTGGVNGAVGVAPRHRHAVHNERVVRRVGIAGASGSTARTIAGTGWLTGDDSTSPATSSETSGRSSRSASRAARSCGASTSGWAATSGHRSAASSTRSVRPRRRPRQPRPRTPRAPGPAVWPGRRQRAPSTAPATAPASPAARRRPAGPGSSAPPGSASSSASEVRTPSARATAGSAGRAASSYRP